MRLLPALVLAACSSPARPQDTVDAVRAKHDIRQILTAVKLFKLEYSRVPTNTEGSAALVNRHLARVPLDPWGRPYLYVTPGRTGDYDVYTRGADGREGGEGDDADVGSWLLRRAAGPVSAPP